MPVDDPYRVASLLGASVDPPALPRALGRVGSLRASLSVDRLRLRGSLPTFLGETAPLGPEGVKRARFQMEDHFGIDLGGAHVSRVEVTADLALPRPPACYLALLGERPRRQRVEYGGTSVSYRTERRWLTFYDKSAERENRGKAALESHTIRAELTYRKRVRHQTGAAAPVTLADLHAPRFLRHLASLWLAEVEAVPLRRLPLPFDGAADLLRSLALAGLSIYGPAYVEAENRAAVEAGRLARSTMYDRRRVLRDLAADPALTAESPLAAEFAAAVRVAATPERTRP